MHFEDFEKRGLNVSRETFSRLTQFVQLLLRWNQKINLISHRSEAEIWHRHVLDSLQLQRFIPDKTKKIVDIGSGAGFPGLVLALAGYENITLVEKNLKKVAFLRNVSRETFLSVQIIPEDVNTLKETFDIVTARGFTDLAALLQISFPLLKKDGYCLFLKGATYESEIFKANLSQLKMTIETIPSITDQKAAILKIAAPNQNEGVKSDFNCHSESKRRGW